MSIVAFVDQMFWSGSAELSSSDQKYARIRAVACIALAAVSICFKKPRLGYIALTVALYGLVKRWEENKAEIAQLSVSLTEKKVALEQSETKITELQTKLEDAEKTLGQSKAEIAQLQVSVTKLVDDLRLLKGDWFDKKTELESELAEVKSCFARAENENSNLQRSQSGGVDQEVLESELVEVRARLARAENESRTFQRSQSCGADQEALKSKLAEVRAQLERAENENSNFQRYRSAYECLRGGLAHILNSPGEAKDKIHALKKLRSGI